MLLATSHEKGGDDESNRIFTYLQHQSFSCPYLSSPQSQTRIMRQRGARNEGFFNSAKAQEGASFDALYKGARQVFVLSFAVP